MVKKKPLKLLFKRNLVKTKSRFFSIFIIVFLGTAFFAGLRNSPVTMIRSIDRYFEEKNFADLTLISSFAFNEDDINEIKDIEGIKEIVPAYRVDAVLKSENSQKETAVIAHGQNNVFHKSDIVEGRDIQAKGECLIDARLPSSLLHQTINLKSQQGSIKLKVVGITNDVRYISNLQRGTNTYTSSTNEGFVIVHDESIKTIAINEGLYDLRGKDQLYNELLISYDTQESLFDQNYDEVNRQIKANITDTMQARLTVYKDQLIEDIDDKLAEPIQQYENGLKEYNKNKQEFTQTINDAKIKILEGKIQIVENKKKLLEAQNEFDNQTSVITDKVGELDQQIKNLQAKIESIGKIESTPSLPEVKLPEVDLPDNSQEAIQQANALIDEMKQKVISLVSELETSLSGVKQLLDANAALASASYELEKASLELEKQEAVLENMEIQTNAQLEEAKQQLDDAKKQIDDALKQKEEIPDGVLYALTCHENAGYVSFESDSSSIDSLSRIFPLVFFLVAALVSLTTMTRMVEEQRLQSGTLLALGYDKKDVMMLYIKYAINATFYATAIGIILGTLSLPTIVYYLYRELMYQVSAPMAISWDWGVIPLTFFISVAITLFVTLCVVLSELKATPAELLRPKPPKQGKRILIERMTFIWKKLSFNQKVTLRNMFRYKKRFFMSIVGIAGCSALIVTGFGLRNSVAQIVPKQFGEVWTYDGSAALSESLNADELEKLQKKVNNQYNIQDTLGLYESSVVASSNNHPSDFHMTYRILSERYNDMIHYYDDDYNELPLEDDGVILTQKASELLGVKEGESLVLTIKDQKYNVTVSKVVQNYYSHYVYFSKTYYESLTNSRVSYNQLLFKMKTADHAHEDSLEKILKEIEPIQSIYYVSTINEDFNTMIQSINMVIIIVIVSAALLAFVVIYNLTNINIQERMNEIATIKVLGFYDKEVYDYVFRENILLSVIGSIVGLGLGMMLHQYLILTVEVDATMFYRHINSFSLIAAIALTMIFTSVINFFMRKSLDRIDMIASLKSIE